MTSRPSLRPSLSLLLALSLVWLGLAVLVLAAQAEHTPEHPHDHPSAIDLNLEEHLTEEQISDLQQAHETEPPMEVPCATDDAADADADADDADADDNADVDAGATAALAAAVNADGSIKPHPFGIFIVCDECLMKNKHPTAKVFRDRHLKEYEGLIVKDLGGFKPKLKLYQTEHYRDASIIGADSTQDELMKILQAGPDALEINKHPLPLVFDVLDMTVAEIHALLLKYGMPRKEQFPSHTEL